MNVPRHDGPQLHLIGYEPGIPVERLIQAVRENRDEFLEAAIGVIKGADTY